MPLSIGRDAADGSNFIKTIGSAVAYAAVALTFAQSVIGGGFDSGKTSSQASTTLAKAPGGLYILAAIGVVIVMIGIGFCIAGIRLKWMDELRMPRKAPVSTLLIATGIIGYSGQRRDAAGSRSARRRLGDDR